MASGFWSGSAATVGPAWRDFYCRLPSPCISFPAMWRLHHRRGAVCGVSPEYSARIRHESAWTTRLGSSTGPSSRRPRSAIFGGILHGAARDSVHRGQLRATLRLTGAALAIALAVARLGIGRDSPRSWDRLSDGVLVRGLSIPDPLVGTDADLRVLGADELVPDHGRASVEDHRASRHSSWLRRAAFVTRMVRTSVLEPFSQDFVRTARAEGVLEALIGRHVLKPAMMPTVTSRVAVDVWCGGGRDGVARQGVGRLALDAILCKDYLLVQGVVLRGRGLRAAQPSRGSSPIIGLTAPGSAMIERAVEGRAVACRRRAAPGVLGRGYHRMGRGGRHGGAGDRADHQHHRACHDGRPVAGRAGAGCPTPPGRPGSGPSSARDGAGPRPRLAQSWLIRGSKPVIGEIHD